MMKGACTFGRPVIASDVSELGRLVRESGLGLLCKPEDPESLAESIREFLAMPEERRAAMAQRALALGRTNSWGAMAERFTQLFEELQRP